MNSLLAQFRLMKVATFSGLLSNIHEGSGMSPELRKALGAETLTAVCRQGCVREPLPDAPVFSRRKSRKSKAQKTARRYNRKR